MYKLNKGVVKMLNLSLNELSALKMVLNYISLTDLLKTALKTYGEGKSEQEKSNYNTIFKAIDTFL